MDNRFQRIKTLYDQACQKPLAERVAFLDQVCAGDLELRNQVESLLVSWDRSSSFLEHPALEVAADIPAAVQSRSLIGCQLGACQVLSLLGKGGMGEVYLARDSRLDRQVALKVLPPEVIEDAERLKRFVREAKAASALNHPNTATIYEIGEAEGIHFILMEYIEGETLEARMQRRGSPSRAFRARSPREGAKGEDPARLGLAETLEIGIQVTDALDAAHSKGIIHRDIKPSNLMLTPRGQVKVLDFGLVKRVHQARPGEGTAATAESQTTTGLIMGTVDYMSPEQVLGQEVDHRTDLFSLGVVLYYLVAGRLPFRGASATETIGKILHAQPEPTARFNNEAPAELERVVGKCLEKKPDLRYQTARDLQVDLKRLRRDSDTSQLTAEVSKPRRSILWGTALLLITIAALTGFWLLQSRRETPEAPLVAIPFTTYPGAELAPSFSPDGNQVAFMWSGEKQDNSDIYIKQIGSESLRRLTTDSRDDGNPAWSPDGQSIAFERGLDAGKAAIMLIPSNGGRERQIATLNTSWGLCWYPNGKWMAVACKQDSPDAPSATFLLSPQTGERRQLISPPKGVTGDRSPAFSPDGRSLVFVRDTGGASELYLLRVSADVSPEGEPKQLTFKDQFIASPAWTPDGKEIVYASGSHAHDWILWRMPVSGSGKPKPLPFSGEGMAFGPAISLNNHRLVYVLMSWDINIWRCQIPRGEEKPAPPSRLIASTRVQEGAQYSPDGKSVAYAAWASGSGEIWVCDADGRNPSQLTHLGGHAPGSPHWSPDGQKIVFNTTVGGQSHSYIIPAQGGEIRQLSHTPFNEVNPAYSRDGKWIYFESDRSGESQVWKMPAEGGQAVQVTRDGGSSALESTDGKTLFYMKRKDELWKAPVDGGEESRVLEEVLNGNFDVKRHGIYYASKPVQNETLFFFYDFASGKTKRVATILKEVDWGFTVSPDERSILFTQQSEDTRADLMLVENFH